MFVVGIADIDITELRNIGSKPSERHVFVVDNFDAFTKIQDNLITFICETATSSMTLFLKSVFSAGKTDETSVFCALVLQHVL